MGLLMSWVFFKIIVQEALFKIIGLWLSSQAHEQAHWYIGSYARTMVLKIGTVKELEN